jgi:hypothetical protein
MTVNLVRVVNQQTVPPGLSRDGSILIDKIDRSQGNSSSPPYAQVAKQKIYIPYKNPADPLVKGYVDLVPTDEVLLAAEPDGSIGGLAIAHTPYPARVTVSVVNSALLATATVTAGNHASPVVIAGTGFLSVLPDLTSVEFTNAAGVKLLVPQAGLTGGAPDSAIQIRVPNASFAALGAPAAGWKIRVLANSKYSNSFTLT